MELLVKGLAVVALIAILVSLGSGLVFLLKDRSQSRRTVRALTVRITLSVIIFLIVVVALATGVITPNRPF
jgi:succinate dehydrogenase hydrophobic anchor subunit